LPRPLTEAAFYNVLNIVHLPTIKINKWGLIVLFQLRIGTLHGLELRVHWSSHNYDSTLKKSMEWKKQAIVETWYSTKTKLLGSSTTRSRVSISLSYLESIAHIFTTHIMIYLDIILRIISAVLTHPIFNDALIYLHWGWNAYMHISFINCMRQLA